MKSYSSYFTLLLFLGIIGCPLSFYGQTAAGQLGKLAGQSLSVPKVSNPSLVPSANLNNVVVGAVFQGLLNSVFNDSGNKQKEAAAQQREAELAAQRAAAQQRYNDSLAQNEYNTMMQSYKPLDGVQNLGTKSLSNTDLNFKSLDGDAETLASDARKQFEGGITLPVSGSTQIGSGATQFFGDTMPQEDLQTLVNPDNNPNVVDLHDAKQFVDEKVKNDSLNIVTLLKQNEPKGNGEPIIQKPDCVKLNRLLSAYTDQRRQFQKTIDLSQNQLEIWETANKNALVNAAKDGFDYFTGQLFDGLKNRGEAAEEMQQIYNTNYDQMVKDGVNVADIQNEIDRLRKISSAGQIAEFISNVNDWNTFVKDGMSSLIAKLSESNNGVKGLLEDPKIKKYFETESPKLSALLDISKIAASNKVFGKWVEKKVPLIAGIEISIKQSYNALDWILSYKRIVDAQKINGGVLDTAKFIQKNIDNTYAALKDCP